MVTTQSILKKYYRVVFIVLLIVVISYLNLDYFCTFKISADNQVYTTGEAVIINCTISNPLPVPVYYRGHRIINTDMSYQNGSTISRTYIEDSDIWAQRAAKEARAASGAVVDRGFLMPTEEKVVKTVIYTPLYGGDTIVDVEYSGVSRFYSSNMNLCIEKYNPRVISVNSTGISLFVDSSNDLDNQTILIKTRNYNLYPVNLPVFYELEIHHGSLDNETKTMVHIDWIISSWTIPANSSITLYDTNIDASEIRKPIYFTLYRKTLRYPPD
jgi:hypothetical protein